jgi:soluble lytic murein transglycosylase-like protein
MIAVVATMAGADVGPAKAANPASAAATTAEQVAQIVASAAARFAIPERWIYAVMHAESAGDGQAISSAGAMGLMQIMPATWSYLRPRYGLGADPFDARDNIMAGAAWLRELHDRYGSPGFLAAYNVGPGRYADHLATGRPLPPETRAYLAALAPVVGGKAVMAPLVDPLAWTRAALFPGESSRIPSADEQAAISWDHPGPMTLFAPLSGPSPRP